MEINELTIRQARKGLERKEFSAVDLVNAFFRAIEEKESELNCYLQIDKDGALHSAGQLDEWISLNKPLPVLAGACLGIKDNILCQGLKCTAGSNILKDYNAVYDATVIKRLKDSGAIILGKLNLDEFAMGSSGEYSSFGVTRNPHDTSKVPGGSSSGPAAAVAAHLCNGALGSDTGGSIRQPAAFCGVVGLKPTYGAVSRYGLIALCSSLDQIGPLAQNVEDAQLIFDAIKGRDEKDGTSLDVHSHLPFIEAAKLKIGVPKEYSVEGIAPDVKESINKAIEKLKEKGVQIVDISLPHTEFALPVYQVIMTAEASSNLARYDGMRYGLSATSPDNGHNDLLNIYCTSRQQGFSAEVRRRIMLGTYVLSAGHYDAYYLRAQKVRTLIKEDFDKAFGQVDFILTPTSPTTAFGFGENSKDPISMYLSDIFTGPVNLAGLPAVSIPCYNSSKDNMPVGLQIIGKPLNEDQIFSVASIFEKNK